MSKTDSSNSQPDEKDLIRCLGCGVLMYRNDPRCGKIVGIILYGQSSFLTRCSICRDAES